MSDTKNPDEIAALKARVNDAALECEIVAELSRAEREHNDPELSPAMVTKLLCMLAEAFNSRAPAVEGCRLTGEQVNKLSRWATAKTTGFGPAFSDALDVAREVAKQDAKIRHQ